MRLAHPPGSPSRPPSGSELDGKLAACGADVSEKLAPENPAAPLKTLTGPGSSVRVLDLTEEICPGGRCSPILGDTYVYMDDDHLTRVFVEEVLAPTVTRELAAATG